MGGRQREKPSEQSDVKATVTHSESKPYIMPTSP